MVCILLKEYSDKDCDVDLEAASTTCGHRLHKKPRKSTAKSSIEIDFAIQRVAFVDLTVEDDIHSLHPEHYGTSITSRQQI